MDHQGQPEACDKAADVYEEAKWVIAENARDDRPEREPVPHRGTLHVSIARTCWHSTVDNVQQVIPLPEAKDYQSIIWSTA